MPHLGSSFWDRMVETFAPTEAAPAEVASAVKTSAPGGARPRTAADTFSLSMQEPDKNLDKNLSSVAPGDPGLLYTTDAADDMQWVEHGRRPTHKEK